MNNRAPVFLLLTANFISGVAQGFSMLAIPWYFVKTNQTFVWGIIFTLTNIGSLFWIPYSGALIDRFDRKKIFLWTSLISGVATAAISGYGFWRQELPWSLVAGAFVVSFLNFNIHFQNIYAFTQEITEEAHYGKVISYIEIQSQATTVMGGAFGALLLEGIHLNGGSGWPILEMRPWHIQEIFCLDAATYFIAFLMILFVRYTPVVKRETETGTVWQRLKTAALYLRTRPRLLLFGMASNIVWIAVVINGFLLMAVYVKYRLNGGGGVFALTDVAYASGAIFSGVAIQRIFGKHDEIPSIIQLICLAGVQFLVLIFCKNVFLALSMLFLLGVGNAGIRILRMKYLFSAIPNQLTGRVNGLLNLSAVAGRIFFSSIFVYSFFSKDGVIYALGLFSFFFAISAFLIRSKIPS